MAEGYRALTDKEKQTLRLMVRGYDAKSLAGRLGISVHAVNERLRQARRKLQVSSSREAARIVFVKEGGSYNSLADKKIGEAPAVAAVEQVTAPNDARRRFARITGGMTVMSLILATLSLSFMAMDGQAPTRADPATPAAAHAADVAGADETGREIIRSAEQWLALVDAEQWQESWDATGQPFKELNSSETWAAVSEEVRPPLGHVVTRAATSRERVPAPPSGYEMVRFRTSFANRAGATETVTLVREGAEWRVVGYVIS